MTDATVSRPEGRRNAFVYILQSQTGLLKIGMSTDPESRLRALLTGHPFGLEIVYLLECDERLAHPIEQATHRILSSAKVSGEWFSVPLPDAIAALSNALSIFLIAAKAPPRNEWMWKCTLNKCGETADVAASPSIKQSQFIEIVMFCLGIAFVILTAIAHHNGESLFPPNIVDSNAKSFGEWTRTIAYYNECGLYLVGPAMVLVTARELRFSWIKRHVLRRP